MTNRPSCSSAIVAVAAGLDVIQPADLLPCGADYLAVALAGRACGAHRVDLIERESIEVDGPRGVGILAVSGGEAVAYNLRTGAQLVVGAGEQFDASRIVRGVQAFGRLFLSDGLVVRVFDPLRRSFTVLKGRFHGKPPSGFAEVELHAGRLYMAGSPEDPRGLFATARGEPTDFDIAPPVPLRGQAFTLAALDRIGAVPHGITGLASLGDDVMVVWTARSMHVLNGDPTEGGGLDLVTPDIGMSKGAPWTRSPEGELYWIDDYGSPWRYTRGGSPERIGVGRIDETLRRLDLRNVRPALVWSREDDGLHIFLTPRGLRAESPAPLLVPADRRLARGLVRARGARAAQRGRDARRHPERAPGRDRVRGRSPACAVARRGHGRRAADLLRRPDRAGGTAATG